MISLPNSGVQITLNEFLPLWRVIEDYIDNQKILSAGVCDFMFPLLSDFYDSCKVIDVKNRIQLQSFVFLFSSTNQVRIKLT